MPSSLLTFRLRAGTVPSGQNCITTLQGVIDAVAKFTTVQVPDGYTLVLISDATPTSEQQTALWIQTNPNGTPEGAYIWTGDEWTRIPSLEIGDVIFRTGLVADIPEGFHQCDGNDGTPDLTGNNNFWEGGAPASVNYSNLNTSYTLFPVVWLGLQD